MRPQARNLRAFYARLLQVTVGLFCLSATSSAWAQVPMCGPDAQSIAAPPIVMPQRDARLAPDKPCEKKRSGLDAAPDPSAPDRAAVSSAYERMLPAGAMMLMGPPPLRLDRAAADAQKARQGALSLVYRPPRAAQ